MRFMSCLRTMPAAVAFSGVVLASTLVALSALPGGAAAAVPKPAKTVTATLITRRSGTLAPGTSVGSAAVVGQRVFTNASHGFALASVGSADYPVATADRGKTWRTNGPALHLHAAQAPLAVAFIGAVNRRKVFAWGGGQVIDTTSDGGRHWYRTLFGNGGPVAVVHNFAGNLLAFIGSFGGSATWQYVSRDGGRTWHFQTTVAR